MNIIVRQLLREEKEKLKKMKNSFGYGAEYKYIWEILKNRGSYTASTKGHIKKFWDI